MSATQPKKILMLTSRHPAYDGRIFHLEAATLRDAGYDVTIVAPQMKDEPEETVSDGIRVICYRKPKRGLKRKWASVAELTKAAMRYEADAFHVHELDPPMLAAIWAKRRLARRGRKVKLIFDAHEVWPFFYAAKTRRPILQHLFKHITLFFEDLFVNSIVDGVVTAHTLEEHYYLFLNPWRPVAKVFNTPPIASWGPPPERKGPIRVLGHDGFFTKHRGMEAMLGAFEQIATEFPDVRLLAAGAFMTDDDEEYFKQWSSRTGLGDRVEVAGWVDRKDAISYLDRMDVGLVANRPDIHSVRCWPANKMMYYLGRGLPVISTPSPLYKRYIDQVRCGVTTPGFSAEAMAKAMRWILRHPEEARRMGQRGYAGAVRDFDDTVSKQRLLAFYKQLGL